MQPLHPFELLHPASVAEAVALLTGAASARPLAGGTDLLPSLRRGIGQSARLVDISRLAELQSIDFGPDALLLGAGVTLARLAVEPRLQGPWQAVAQAAASVAGPAQRSAATLGGNLCLDTRCVYYNQSAWWRAANGHCLKHGGTVCHVAPQGRHCHAAYCADLAPVLLALQAEIALAGPGGARRVALADLYRDDGAAHLCLEPGELLTRVILPNPPAGLACGYRKARTRGAMDFPLAGVACALALHDGRITQLRLALTGTNPRPFLLAGVEALHGQVVDAALLAQLSRLVQKQVAPMRSTVTPSNYRRQVAAALAQRLLAQLAATAAAGAPGPGRGALG